MQNTNYTELGKQMAEAVANNDRQTIERIKEQIRAKQTWRKDTPTLRDLLTK